MTPKELYRERITELTAEIKQLNKYNHLMVVLELLAVALAVICVVLYTTWEVGIVSLIGAALSIALYIAIRWKDNKNSRLSEEKESMRNVYQKELAYLHGDYSGFSSGEQYINPHHEFSLDLDIFGPQSLFHRINRTVTSGGSDFLAKELAETRVRTKAEIEQRREAACELAAKEPLRTAFLAATHGKHVNTSDVLKALSEIKASNCHAHFPSCCQQVIVCDSHWKHHRILWIVVRSHLRPIVRYTPSTMGAATDNSGLSCIRTDTEASPSEYRHDTAPSFHLCQHDHADCHI